MDPLKANRRTVTCGIHLLLGEGIVVVCSR
jgi:hypothetical protein